MAPYDRIYTMVVRAIVNNAATVWWPNVKLKKNKAELSKLQRMACLCITGAMKTAPTAEIEVVVRLPTCTSSWWLRPETFVDMLQRSLETQIGRF
jgi:hypothetical protein